MSYRYRLFDTDGNDIGETRLAILVTSGEEIVKGPDEPNQRVVEVVAVMETERVRSSLSCTLSQRERSPVDCDRYPATTGGS